MIRQYVTFVLFLVFCSCSFGQVTCLETSPYSYNSTLGVYEFQHDESEILWNYKIMSFFPSVVNDVSWNTHLANYTAIVQFRFLDSDDDELFQLTSSCLILTEIPGYFSNNLHSSCYDDVVKVEITILLYNNSEGQCDVEDSIARLFYIKEIENPRDGDKNYNCVNSLDTISYKPLNNDSINFLLNISRYTDYYIQSYDRKYKCYQVGENQHCDTVYLAADNFCIGDSLSVNFNLPTYSLLPGCTENIKLFIQYNDLEPEEIIPDGNNFRARTTYRYACPFYLRDEDCERSFDGELNQYEIYAQADTINDPSYLYNNRFTKVTYYLSTQTICGGDNFYTISHSFYVYKPLKHIPYEVHHDCTNDASGSIKLSMAQRHGGYILHNFAVSSNSTNAPNVFDYGKCNMYFCDSSYLNIPDEFDYSLLKDNIFNDTYDELCSFLYSEGSLCGNCENAQIEGLVEGDYKIIITPVKSDCDELIDDSAFGLNSGQGGGASPNINLNCCRKKTNCIGEPLIFTFTVKKYNYAKPLGEDRILCQDSTVILSVPEIYTTEGNSAVWGTAFCGVNSAVSPGNLHQRKVQNGGGGYHTIAITTTEGCLIRDTVIVADLKPVTLNIQLPTALATNAVKYSSGWPTQFNTIQWEDKEQLEYFADANIYFNGNAGVFRPSKSYDYADSLNSTSNLIRSDANPEPVSQLNEIYIRDAGSIIDYKFFNYGNPLFSDCVPQWVYNNQMTKYSPSGYDVENKDILEIHSAALYGYRDKLPVAVCSNAKMDEIGYESFEEYTPVTYGTITQLTNSTGNIDIIRETESLMMPKSRVYEVVRGFNRYAMIKGNICSACDEPFKANVSAQSVPYDFTTEKIKDQNFVSNATKVMASPCGDSSYTILRLDEGLPSDQMEFKCRFWTGIVSTVSKRYVPHVGPYDLDLDDEISHTGIYSLKLPSGERVLIPQSDLELIPRKTYHVGAWVYHADMKTQSPEKLKYTNQQDSIGILVVLPNGEKVFAFPSGEVINGWQRVEGIFTMPAGTRTEIQLGFVGKRTFNIDDIRIFPQNSAIQTYVYDPQNYKVRAVLDQNNFATVYQYDDEGNLFAVKKETIKGIKTIQVSSSHIKSTKP